MEKEATPCISEGSTEELRTFACFRLERKSLTPPGLCLAVGMAGRETVILNPILSLLFTFYVLTFKNIFLTFAFWQSWDQ